MLVTLGRKGWVVVRKGDQVVAEVQGRIPMYNRMKRCVLYDCQWLQAVVEAPVGGDFGRGQRLKAECQGWVCDSVWCGASQVHCGWFHSS